MSEYSQCDSACDKAYAAFQAGDKAQAMTLCRAILNLTPHHARTLYLLGVLHQEVNQFHSAREAIEQACQQEPGNGLYANALGELHQVVGDRERALTCFQKSADLNPNYARVWNNLGLLHHQSAQSDLACQCFQKAVALNPSYAIAWNNLGAVYQSNKGYDASIPCFQKAIQARPTYPEAWFNLGVSQLNLERPSEAAGCFQKAIAFRPGYDRAHFQLGLLLQKFRNDYQALACFQKAVELNPNNDEYARMLGDHLLVKKDWASALSALEKARELDPQCPMNLARLFYARQLVCDWQGYQDTVEELWRHCELEMAAGRSSPVGPFHSLTMPWSCQRLQAIAQSLSRQFERKPLPAPFQADTNSRIRIGYVSGDLYDHAVGHLLHGFFEKHDRNRFEVFVYSFSPADASVYRQRMEKGAEHFVDVSAVDSLGLARRIQEDGIQILVDLMGYTGVHRTEIFARRAAPLQVSFLGMLGTMGADFMDYLIADPVVVPLQQENCFDERVIRLPHSYLIAELIPSGENTTRADHHLPPDRFVFCSFNNSYKIEPFSFGCWMSILRQVPESVLWLNSSGTLMEKNLRREATQAGVAPDRLVFGPFADCPRHIERQRHADLFLDTFLYNAAATGSMALQAGLPILTLHGETFASRVGSSLLNAVGLNELITRSPEEYMAKAVELATERAKLSNLRSKLESGKTRLPLFDSARFVQNLEKALLLIWEKHIFGAQPVPLTITE